MRNYKLPSSLNSDLVLFYAGCASWHETSCVSWGLGSELGTLTSHHCAEKQVNIHHSSSFIVAQCYRAKLNLVSSVETDLC